MSTFREGVPDASAAFTPPGDFAWRDYFRKQNDWLQGVAKEQEENYFVAPQKIAVNGVIHNGGILLENAYFGALDIQLSTDNIGAHPIGGQAGIYVQHYIDNGIATTNNVNSGIRVQIESGQQRTGTFVNDVVGGYFGVRNDGVDVGGFGVHVDAYSNGLGANTTMYGVSAEMYRETNLGFTAAFHARSIDASGYYDNDYGFLASPSVGGSLKFAKIFSGGSSHTGTMNCDYGLDLAFAACNIAAIRINELQAFIWDGTPEAVYQIYDPVGEWQHYVSGSKLFGFENTGRLYNISNANTDYAAAGAASGRFWAINLGGTVYKIELLNF